MEFSFLCIVNDLCAVLEVTADAKEQWEELGRLLGIDSNKLSKISRDHSSILLRYSEMMKYWIKQVGASWKNLVHALESPLMNEIAVAQKITNKYLGMVLIIIIITMYNNV